MYGGGNRRPSTGEDDRTAQAPNPLPGAGTDQEDPTSPTNTMLCELSDTFFDDLFEHELAQREKQHHTLPAQARSPIHRKPVPRRDDQAHTDTAPTNAPTCPGLKQNAPGKIAPESPDRPAHQPLAQHPDGTPRPDSPTYVDDYFTLRDETGRSARNENLGSASASNGRSHAVSPDRENIKPGGQRSWYDEGDT